MATDVVLLHGRIITLASTHKLVEGGPQIPPPGDTRKTVILPDPKPSVIKIRRGGVLSPGGRDQSGVDLRSTWFRSGIDLKTI